MSNIRINRSPFFFRLLSSPKVTKDALTSGFGTDWPSQGEGQLEPQGVLIFEKKGSWWRIAGLLTGPGYLAPLEGWTLMALVPPMASLAGGQGKETRHGEGMGAA